VLPQALAPFAGPYGPGNACGYSHDGNPLNWVDYMNRMLTAIKQSGGIDGIAVHINSRGYSQGAIHSTARMDAGGRELYSSFYVYKDWVDYGIPEDLYHLPIYATESNGIYYWSGGHPESPSSHYEPGWVQEIYAEIDRYNQQAAATGKPIYRAVNLYRWCAWCDGWNIDRSVYKGQILSDLDEAVAAGYRWPDGGEPPPPPPPPPEPTGDNVARGAVAWTASSSYSDQYGGDKAIDGVVSPASKWTSDGQSAESWLALDLGADHELTDFVVRHAGTADEPTAYNTQSYRLETGASLGGPWTTLESVDNASGANVSATTLPSPARARYVRLYITDAGIDDYARIPEFEIYGVPLPTEQNVARGAVAWTASSSYNDQYGGDKAIDGVISQASKWTSDGQTAVSWLALDLGRSHEVTRLVVRHAGDAGELKAFNTQAFQLQAGTSLSGPWTTVASVDNGGQADVSTETLASPATTRFVRLYITDAGIDNYARIPELEVYGAPLPDATPLIVNGDFADGLTGWSTWEQRGSLAPQVVNGQLQLAARDFNAGVYQRFATGGAGTALRVDGFWSSDPTIANAQWAEVLVINGDRQPQNGEDIHAGQADVVLLYKNDTWTTPGGWSGPLRDTAPVGGDGGFVAAGAEATLVLKAGSITGSMTGVRLDDIMLTADGPPSANLPPDAVAAANPTTGVAPLAVTFDGSGSSDPDGDALSYHWDYGDGAQAAGATVSHTYADPGSYSVTLTVSDGRGGSDAATLSISVTRSTVILPDYCPAALDFAAVRESLASQGQSMATVKIGFHVGPGGNQQGLGEWMRCLDAAGVPFFLKSVDAAGSIWEAAQLKAASGVPHVLVYRRSVGDGWNWDVPDYNRPPAAEAASHWQRHRDEFPPELEPYKHLIWIESINEVDKNRSEWLGEFAYHTAQIALEQGFNWAAFGWSSGEPEREHWTGPWMQQFLRLAAQHPDRVAVALHEYSYVRDNLDRLYPNLVGRFQMLFDVADQLGIRRPTVLITEFGWVYDNIAPIGQAMEVDLPWAAELYAAHPEVLGAAIWYLGPGFGGIANRAQRLIAPLTEYSLQTYFVVP
jgi:PKD repeat protein